MARTSAFAFRGKEQDVREIGARLNVENILEGSVRKAGNRIRVTAQLVKVGDGYHLWSQRFDREMTDVFAIQDEISQAIVAKLRVRLAGDRPLVKRHTQNVEAYDLFPAAHHCLLRPDARSAREGKEYLGRPSRWIRTMRWPTPAWAEYSLDQAPLGSGTETLLQGPNRRRMEAASRMTRWPEAHALSESLRGPPTSIGWEPEQEFRRALETQPDSSDGPLLTMIHLSPAEWGGWTKHYRDCDRGRWTWIRSLGAVQRPSAYLYSRTAWQYDLAIAQHTARIACSRWYLPHWAARHPSHEHMEMFEEADCLGSKSM